MLDKLSRNQRIALALVAGVTVAGAVGASAASLGTLTTRQLGSSADTVTSCNGAGGITVTWIAASISYSQNLGVYGYDGLALTGINANCNTSTYSLSVAKTAGAGSLLATTTGNLSVVNGGATVRFSSLVDVSDTYRVALVLSGT